MTKRIKIAVAVLATGAMAGLGVGCTAPPGTSQSDYDQWVGSSLFGLIYIALCQANNGQCPFPIAPVAPTP